MLRAFKQTWGVSFGWDNIDMTSATTDISLFTGKDTRLLSNRCKPWTRNMSHVAPLQTVLRTIQKKHKWQWLKSTIIHRGHFAELLTLKKVFFYCVLFLAWQNCTFINKCAKLNIWGPGQETVGFGVHSSKQPCTEQSEHTLWFSHFVLPILI